MSFWQRLWSRAAPPSAPPRLPESLVQAGWLAQPPDGEFHVWRDAHGHVLTRTARAQELGLPSLSDARSLREFGRQLAESREGGLIEIIAEQDRAMVHWIYKRLQRPAYVITGMLAVLRPEGQFVWTVVCGECGVTGLREAIVAAELLEAGALTPERYQSGWAQDPYEPTYQGVDRSVLRFVSDDAVYDDRLPDHPLSKVRRVLAALSSSIEADSGTAAAGDA
jgi:hypothetical protein